MSKTEKKTEINHRENVLETFHTDVKKKKHNSKRRRCKKNEIATESVDLHEKKMDEVVNFLLNTISKNESTTSVDTDPPVKVAKESQIGVKLNNNQNNKNFTSECKNAPSSSVTDLNDLFENLQVHSLKNKKKSNNGVKFFNTELLRSKNVQLSSAKNVESLKHDKLKKTRNKNEDQVDISSKKIIGFFNSNLTQQYPRKCPMKQIDSSSTLLNTELSTSLTEMSFQKKIMTDYFNANSSVKMENHLITSLKPTSKLLLNKLEKTLQVDNEKNKTFAKNKNVRKNETKNDSLSNDIYEKPLSITDEKKDESESTILSPQTTKNKKRQHSSKNSTEKVDMKFPEYLSSDELQSVSNYGVLLSGIIRINQKNYKEAYITAPDKGMDILIEGLRDRNRALEGDEVYFVLKSKEHHRSSVDSTDVQRTAVVVGIKTFNHNRGAIGTLNVIKNKKVNYALFSPRDSRLPRIRIKKKNWPTGFSEDSVSFQNKLYFAKISHWKDLRFADGELIKEVGIVGDIEAETDALLLKYELNVTPYDESLKQYIPPPSYKISQNDIEGREDLRKECVFTIDPASAADLDDAVSCKSLPNGNYEVGVHISDVSYFLTEGTPLDSAVCERATTVYLVQRAYHMLPYELCRLCSLTPGQDKLSFSVIWEVTPSCEIIGHRFARTVINSCAKFAYEQVQSLLDLTLVESAFPEVHGGHNINSIKESIFFLHKMSMNLRNKRFDNGALKLDQKKIRFIMDENLLPIQFTVEEHKESHQLIEELMLLANITVAKELISCFPTIAFLRCHSPPLAFVLEKVQKSLEKYGIILDISTSGSLQSSLVEFSGDDTESMARMLILHNIIAKPMARAKYYCASIYPNEEDRRHYALNVPYYTHFTSPIRRYADVIVHRLLAASLGYCDPPKWTADYVQKIASNCNKQKYAAKMAGETSTELFLSIYIGLKGVVICEAVVSDIKDQSFDCIVLSTGAHQRLYYKHVKAELSQEKRDGISRLNIRWPIDKNHDKETIQIIEMFSIVKIELRRAQVLKVEARLLRY